MKILKDYLSEAKAEAWVKQADKLNKELSKLFGKSAGEFVDDSGSDMMRVVYEQRQLPTIWNPENMTKLSSIMKKYKTMMFVGTKGEFTFGFSK